MILSPLLALLLALLLSLLLALLLSLLLALLLSRPVRDRLLGEEGRDLMNVALLRGCVDSLQLLTLEGELRSLESK